MTRVLSLPGRQHADDPVSGSVVAVLIEVDDDTLPAPLRFSTDPTERISSDPLLYGTRSTWRGANPATEPFLFAAVAVELPGEYEDDGQTARLFVSGINSGLLQSLREICDCARCHMAVVLADQPDTPEMEMTDMEILGAASDGARIELNLTQVPIWLENFPAARMTQQRFPALYR